MSNVHNLYEMYVNIYVVQSRILFNKKINKNILEQNLLEFSSYIYFENYLLDTSISIFSPSQRKEYQVHMK